MNVEIANRLMELRKQKGYSQEDLAAKIGVSRQAISKWERSESSPDTNNLILLARLYGISLDELVNTNATSAEIREENVPFRDEEMNNPSFRAKDFNGMDKNMHAHRDRKNDNRWRRSFGQSVIESITALLVTITYLIIGFSGVPKGWTGGWTFFLLIPIVSSLIFAIRTRKYSNFAYPVLATFVYLGIGLWFEVWHPTWLIFLTIPLYYTLAGAIDKARKRKVSEDSLEE